MMRGMLRQVGRFLVSVTDDQLTSASVGSAASSRDLHEFAQQATQLAQRRGRSKPLLAGGIELLGLRDITDDIPRGHQLDPQSVADLAEQAILRNLGPRDNYIKKDKENFLLCFASPDSGVAKHKLEKIAEEIRDSLVEHDYDSEFGVGHDIVEIDTAAVDDESIIDSITDSLKRVRQEAEDNSRLWRQHLIRNTSVSYRPVWSSRRQVVAVHRAGLDDETGRLALKKLASLSSADEMRDTLFEIDSLILGRATTDLHRLIGEGGRTQLIIPLYYDSLESRRRWSRYQEICENIPAAYRRYLLFEVHDIPSGTPQSRISTLISMLNNYGRGVLLEVDTAASNMPSAMGIVGVVARVPSGDGRPKDMVLQLERFRSGAQSAKLKSFLYGVQSSEAARSGTASGVDYLEGTAIAKSTKTLRTHYRWNLSVAS